VNCRAHDREAARSNRPRAPESSHVWHQAAQRLLELDRVINFAQLPLGTATNRVVLRGRHWDGHCECCYEPRVWACASRPC